MNILSCCLWEQRSEAGPGWRNTLQETLAKLKASEITSYNCSRARSICWWSRLWALTGVWSPAAPRVQNLSPSINAHPWDKRPGYVAAGQRLLLSGKLCSSPGHSHVISRSTASPQEKAVASAGAPPPPSPARPRPQRLSCSFTPTRNAVVLPILHHHVLTLKITCGCRSATCPRLSEPGCRQQQAAMGCAPLQIKLYALKQGTDKPIFHSRNVFICLISAEWLPALKMGVPAQHRCQTLGWASATCWWPVSIPSSTGPSYWGFSKSSMNSILFPQTSPKLGKQHP